MSEKADRNISFDGLVSGSSVVTGDVNVIGSMGDVYENIDPQDIYYLAIEVNKTDPNATMLQIATALDLMVAKDNEPLPFIPYKDFNEYKSENKLFIYGTTGSGKSRSIFEIMKEKITNFQNVYIINPAEGLHSGAVKGSISDLVYRIGGKDAVIWDDFPTGLLQPQNVENALKALAKISSITVKNVLVSLNSLDLLTPSPFIAWKAAGLSKCEIRYREKDMENILVGYGRNISKFKPVFQQFVSTDIPEIARILWTREPTPLTILLYYETLTNTIKQGSQEPLAYLNVAEMLSLSGSYYMSQFEYIRFELGAEADFLYTLKLSYELELERSPSFLRKLQYDIFGTLLPEEPSPHLSMWIYKSRANYVMPDVAREAIEFSVDAKVKIMHYFRTNFHVIPDEEENMFLFGFLLGENVEYYPDPQTFGSYLDDIMRNINHKSSFQEGLGTGICMVFPLMDRNLQKKIWNVAEGKNSFLKGFGYGMGVNFASLDEETQVMLLDMAQKSAIFSNNLGDGMGARFVSLDKKHKNLIKSIAEKNAEVAHSLGNSLGANFASLDEETQVMLLDMAQKNASFSNGLGDGPGRNFSLLSRRVQEKILNGIKNPSDFGLAMSYGLGNNFATLNSADQNRVLTIADERPEIANELVYGGIGNNFHLLQPSIQKRILEMVENNRESAYSFGYSLHDNLSSIVQNEDIRIAMRRMTEKIKKFDEGLKGARVSQ